MRHPFEIQKEAAQIPAETLGANLAPKKSSLRLTLQPTRIKFFHIVIYPLYPLLLPAITNPLFRNLRGETCRIQSKIQEANPDKVTRASRITNYRARAKKIPEIVAQGEDAVIRWAEEGEARAGEVRRV